jgi:hypothetical protein
MTIDSRDATCGGVRNGLILSIDGLGNIDALVAADLLEILERDSEGRPLRVRLTEAAMQLNKEGS